MRNRFKYLVLAAALVAVLALAGCSGETGVSSGSAVSALRSAAETGATPSPRTISVTGTGKAIAAPDIAYITVGVDTKSSSAIVAAEENNQKMNGVVAAIKGLGIEDKDIQTVNYNIYVEQEYDREGKPTGERQYRVVNEVRVRVRNLDNVGKLLEQAVVAGANTVGNISFSLSDPAALQKQARDAAIADARERAQQLAAGLDVKLGPAQQVSEWGGEVPASTMYESRVRVEQAMAAPSISGGELSVSVQVAVTFAIE